VNLEKASTQHRNVIVSFASLLLLGGAYANSQAVEPSILQVVIAWGFFIYHWSSLNLLAKHLNKNRILWTISSVLSPILIFIPSAICILKANKVFKDNAWKVLFYGGARPLEETDNNQINKGQG
jgi:hypothetical protein